MMKRAGTGPNNVTSQNTQEGAPGVCLKLARISCLHQGWVSVRLWSSHTGLLPPWSLGLKQLLPSLLNMEERTTENGRGAGEY